MEGVAWLVWQFRELIVGQAAEEADSAKLVGAHHIVARLLMRSAFGWPRRLPRGEAGGTDRDVSHRLYPQPMTWADCGVEVGAVEEPWHAAGYQLGDLVGDSVAASDDVVRA
jgi:hypothetical protein